MLPILIALNVFLPVIYAMSAIWYGNYFVNKTPKMARMASFWLLVGIFLHLAFLIIKGLHFGVFPITNSFESLSMLAFNIAVIYYITEKLKKEYTTGIFFLVIVLLFQITATFLFQTTHNSEPLKNPLFGVHLSFTLLGLSALAISSLYATMYCMLAKRIKNRQFGVVYQGLPPLETLDSMRQNATVCGIILLGTGLFLGHLHAFRIKGYFGFTDPKVIIADMAWCAFTIICCWNWKKGVHGLRTNLFSVWLFIIVAILEFLVGTFHRFG